MSCGSDDTIQKCMDHLKQRGIKVLIWDMDLTAALLHSHGRLSRGEPLEEYLSKPSQDFCKLVPSLHKEGFKLAIATHSDEAEYRGPIRKETHILGDELAKAFLERQFDKEISDSFYVVAYNPWVQENWFKVAFCGGWSKRKHMTDISSHYRVQPDEMVLFDDAGHIVQDCVKSCGVHGVSVNPKTAFVLADAFKI